MDGDAPFTLEKESLVKTEIDRIHKKLDSQLEQDAYYIVKDKLGSEYVEKNILNFKGTLNEDNRCSGKAYFATGHAEANQNANCNFNVTLYWYDDKLS